MGATGWMYSVPYQDDVQDALRHLQEELFVSGKYRKAWQDWEPDHPNFSLPLPTTIPELLEYSETAETHSAIDLDPDHLAPYPSDLRYTFVWNGSSHPRDH